MWPIKNAAGDNECHITHICVNGSYGRQHSCPAPKLMFDSCASKDASGKCSGEYYIVRSFYLTFFSDSHNVGNKDPI